LAVVRIFKQGRVRWLEQPVLDREFDSAEQRMSAQNVVDPNGLEIPELFPVLGVHFRLEMHAS
jgi:hypothetical protein